MVATNKAQHTPGPWKAFEYREDSTGELVIGVGTDYPPGQLGDGSRSIVTMTGGYYTRPGEFHKPEAAPINRANAHLVAAAPDLLAALRDILLDMAANESNGLSVKSARKWASVHRARAAIARATGSTTQGAAAAVAVALGRSPTEPGTARLAADLERGAK